MDLGHVLSEIENKEKARLLDLPFKSSAFQSPEDQIGQLEYTTYKVLVKTLSQHT